MRLLEIITRKNIWPLGRVLENWTKSDGIARLCEPETKLGTLTRQAKKIELASLKKRRETKFFRHTIKIGQLPLPFGLKT